MKFLFLFILLSCASTPGIKEEVSQGHISAKSVLDLGRSAYLKGCVDGKNLFAPKLKESSFVKCRELSKIYENDLKEILTGDKKKED